MCGQTPRIGSENLSHSKAGSKNVHEDFDGRGLPRAIRTNQSVDATFGDFQVQPVEHLRAAESFHQVDRAQDAAHVFLPSSRFQCFVSAAATSSSSRPIFLASTTRCSISFFSKLPRSAADDNARSATTEPRPGRTPINPSPTRCVITLCAVLGLILRP